MTNIQNDYLWWLYCLVAYDRDRSYTDLFTALYSTDYVYTIGMDSNRESDGICLRYRFGEENGIPQAIIASELDSKPCSVLEVLIALAYRLEESIMGDPDLGLDPGKWFWLMIKNIGLIDSHDSNFDISIVSECVDRFLWRKYDHDGSNGGAFILLNPRQDLKKTELWYQAMWYLTENYA